MDIDRLEEVTALRNHRKRALELREMARANTIECVLWQNGAKVDVFSAISAECVRQAIIEGCTEFIVEANHTLADLGVSVPPLDEAPRTEADWKRDCHMFVRAWIRALGGKLIPKTHLIDSLVITTTKLREDAEAAASARAGDVPRRWA